MNLRLNVISLLIIGLMTMMCFEAWAHGGHKKEEDTIPTEEFTAQDSMYSVKEGDADPVESQEDLFGSSLSKSDDLFGGTEPMSREMTGHQEHIKNGEMDHQQHQPSVEISTLQWVSPSQEGYGVAAGITVLAGMIFGVLSFFRQCE